MLRFLRACSRSFFVQRVLILLGIAVHAWGADLPDAFSATRSCESCPWTYPDLARGYALAQAVINRMPIIVATQRDIDPMPFDWERDAYRLDTFFNGYAEWSLRQVVHAGSEAGISASVALHIPRVIMDSRTGHAWDHIQENNAFFLLPEQPREAYQVEALIAMEPIRLHPRMTSATTMAIIHAHTGTRAVFAAYRHERLSGIIAMASPRWLALERASSVAERQTILRNAYEQDSRQRAALRHKSRNGDDPSSRPISYEDFVVETTVSGSTRHYRELITDATQLATAFRAGTALPLPRSEAGAAMRHFLLLQLAEQPTPSFRSVVWALEQQQKKKRE